MTLREQLLEALPFPSVELDNLIATAQYRYKVYTIPKRRPRQFRVIAQPTAEVKLVQRWLLANSLAKLRIHHAATAYRHGVSISAHAALHTGNRFLLKIDFKDFFPSIHSFDLLKLLIEEHSFTYEDALTICKIVSWRDKTNGRLCLSIGAPTSPLLSNAMLFRFDEEISRVVRDLDCRYSRYADDLAFSTNARNLLLHVKVAVEDVIERMPYPRLTINEEKTVSVSKAGRLTLVGLLLTPEGQVSIGRERKKHLRAQVYRFGCGYLLSGEASSLRGELAFAWSIEPQFVLSLVKTYGRDLFERLELPFGRG